MIASGVLTSDESDHGTANSKIKDVQGAGEGSDHDPHPIRRRPNRVHDERREQQPGRGREREGAPAGENVAQIIHGELIAALDSRRSGHWCPAISGAPGARARRVGEAAAARENRTAILAAAKGRGRFLRPVVFRVLSAPTRGVAPSGEALVVTVDARRLCRRSTEFGPAVDR